MSVFSARFWRSKHWANRASSKKKIQWETEVCYYCSIPLAFVCCCFLLPFLDFINLSAVRIDLTKYISTYTKQQTPHLWIEGTGEGCGFSSSLKLPSWVQMSQQFCRRLRVLMYVKTWKNVVHVEKGDKFFKPKLPSLIWLKHFCGPESHESFIGPFNWLAVTV